MNDYLDFSLTLADQASLITLKYFRKKLITEIKMDMTPVTLVDRTTESHLRKLISQTYPDHGIIGEEEADKTSDSPFQWIIDPIDGTKNFISGIPLFGTLICLLEHGKPILSVIDIPAQNERWSCVKGEKTHYQGKQVIASKKEDIAECILCSTDLTMFNDAELKQISLLNNSVKLKRYNGDCYLYGMLASGWIDIVLEADLKVFDFMPLIPIVEGAGGIITDWQGNPLTKFSNGQVIACANRVLHDKAISLLNCTV